jgi:hypothetical protein
MVIMYHGIKIKKVTDYLLRQSGNMPAEQVQQLGLIQEIQTQIWKEQVGLMITVVVKLIL